MTNEMPAEEELIDAMAQAMQKQFPVVRHGADSNGNWSVKPLEIEVFKRSSKLAFQAMLKLLPEMPSCTDISDLKAYVKTLEYYREFYETLLSMRG